MKILGSYKKMMYEFIDEADGEKHKPGDVWKSDRTGNWQAMGPNGDQESFGKDKEAAEKYANPDGKEKDSDDAGKLSGGDFSRDAGEPSDMDTERPADEPEDEVPGVNAPDKPKDKPEKTKPEDFTSDLADDEEAGQIANRLAQDELSAEYTHDDMEKELTDMGHGDLAKAIRNADSDEEKAALISKATEAPDEDGDGESDKEEVINSLTKQIDGEVNSMDPDVDKIKKLMNQRAKLDPDSYEPFEEGVKIINGKKYKAIKESKTHILKENYKRFFGEK